MTIDQCVIVKTACDVARGFYYDTLVYGQGSLSLLLDSADRDRLLMGTDYPFAVMQSDPVAFLKSAVPDLAMKIAGGAVSLLQTREPLT